LLSACYPRANSVASATAAHGLGERVWHGTGQRGPTFRPHCWAPDGLEYIDSWVEPNFSRCFQVMRCDDLRLFEQWTLSWRGFGVEIEIIPVVSSQETREVVAPHLHISA
jgi:hypothetical protein